MNTIFAAMLNGWEVLAKGFQRGIREFRKACRELAKDIHRR
jgi:hypothetical protein